jgi:DNA-binding HxlR family transcriptional regulator
VTIVYEGEVSHRDSTGGGGTIGTGEVQWMTAGGGITHRTLSKTLKEMEAAGLVARTDYGEIPPRVDYTLTADGESLRPVLEAMETWARTRAAPQD